MGTNTARTYKLTFSTICSKWTKTRSSCFCEKETLLTLLSTGLFKERILAGFNNQTELY